MRDPRRGRKRLFRASFKAARGHDSSSETIVCALFTPATVDRRLVRGLVSLSSLERAQCIKSACPHDMPMVERGDGGTGERAHRKIHCTRSK
jgi:hypothetical protein